MARRRKKIESLKKRNLAAKLAQRQPSAGPMDDKRRKSRQQERIEDLERLRNQTSDDCP